MDIKQLLNSPAAPAPPPVGVPRGNPAPPTARVGKERVQRPCVKCGTKNHIRSTHCSQCQTVLRPQASSTSKTSSGSRAAPPSTVVSKSATGIPAVVPHGPAASGAGIGVGGGTPGHYGPVTSSRHSTSSSRGSFASGPKHLYPPHASPPATGLGRAAPDTQKKRAHGAPSSSTSPYPPAHAAPGGVPDRSANERMQRVMRTCQGCGNSNHIRSGSCKTCGKAFENQGRQRTQKR